MFIDCLCRKYTLTKESVVYVIVDLYCGTLCQKLYTAQQILLNLKYLFKNILMWLCNVIYFCISNCVCCAQGVAEEQLQLMLPPCSNNKINKKIKKATDEAVHHDRAFMQNSATRQNNNQV